MATNYKPWNEGDRYGVWYRFDKAGEGISMHCHTDKSTWHNTICLKGAVELYGDELDIVVKAGETGEFKSYRQHEIKALEDGTEIVNMFINGCPSGYPQESGIVESVLQGRIYD